jgi:hypothetical protein
MRPEAVSGGGRLLGGGGVGCWSGAECDKIPSGSCEAAAKGESASGVSGVPN